MFKVYLAGPITGCSYKNCTDWRQAVRAALVDYDIECYSPMRAKEYLDKKDEPITTAMGHQPSSEQVMSSPPAILARDRYDVMSSDLVFVNLLGYPDRVSIGTMVEIGWADACRKPIVLAMEPRNNCHDHAFVRVLAGFHVTSLEQGILVIKSILLPDVAQCDADVQQQKEGLARLKEMTRNEQRKLKEEREAFLRRHPQTED